MAQKSYEEISEIVPAYLDGWNDCQAAVVATLAVHLGLESSI